MPYGYVIHGLVRLYIDIYFMHGKMQIVNINEKNKR